MSIGPIQSKRDTIYRVGIILWEIEHADTDQHESEPVEEEYVGGDFESYEDALILFTALLQDTTLFKEVKERIREEKEAKNHEPKHA